jgi:hypothetical protein
VRESKIQADIMEELGKHPQVAWVMVVTSGKFRVRGSFIAIGQYVSKGEKQKTGMSDIIGQLISGQFFSIEVKKPDETPTNEQFNFMQLVITNKGISGWATNAKEAVEIIESNNEILTTINEG